MRDPVSQPATWPFQWFGIYSLAYALPLLIVAVLLLEREAVFVGISACLTLAVGWHAWRSASGRVGILWRIALGAVMSATLAYALLLVLAPAGETGICYDRLVKKHPWARIENLGPDPYCRGIPIDAAMER